MPGVTLNTRHFFITGFFGKSIVKQPEVSLGSFLTYRVALTRVFGKVIR